jgi:4-hydroxyphenylacetate 3-monooxygenase
MTTGGLLTGADYLASLRDGRRVYLNGERVAEVPEHPAFRNAARSIARLYDSLHAGPQRDVLTRETDTGSGTRTHRFFVPSRSAEELVEAGQAIAAWARLSYGWMSRSPDYKAAFTAMLGPSADYFHPYQENARRWHREIQERAWFLNHALANPSVDREQPTEATGDVLLHVERETDAGLVVSGAKTVATSAALTNFNLIGALGALPIEAARYALVFFVPMAARGLTMLCRPSYELRAAVLGSPFDNPLSSRFDENDSVLVFERVLVPWEDVLISGDLSRARMFLPTSGFLHRLTFHSCIRLAVKLDFMVGLLLAALDAVGAAANRTAQARLGQVVAWRNVMWAISSAQARQPQPGPGRTVLPNLSFGSAYRTLGATAWAESRTAALDLLASGLIALPSSREDFANPELRPILDRFFRGSQGMDAETRVKVMKLLWDAVGSEFAGRQELYERNFAGSQESVRLAALQQLNASGEAENCRDLVARCLADYDLDGWRGDGYGAPDSPPSADGLARRDSPELRAT